jgi:hypothetical protein
VLRVTVWGIPTFGSAIIRHARLPISPLAVEHPTECISNSSCREKREEWIAGRLTGDKSLALTNKPLSLRLAFARLPCVVLTSLVDVMGCTSSLIGNVMQGFPHLIQDLLGLVLLPMALLVIW